MAAVGPSAARLGESALGTLPLLVYLALAVALMVSDHRGGIGNQIRQRASALAEPVWWLAASPLRLARAVGEQVQTSRDLRAENLRLRRELEVQGARLHRLGAVAEENTRLRELLGGTRGYQLSAQLVGILEVDLDPWRQRIVLDAGRDRRVEVGQVLIDGGGVLGQVIEVGAHRSTALLLTDPEHAVPVQVLRSGLRAIAYGTGEAGRLRLPNVAQSADIRVGDALVTSGIGGRFPAGFPVGTVTALNPDPSRLFVVADARPAAQLERGRELLLVNDRRDETGLGPPLPAAPESPR